MNRAELAKKLGISENSIKSNFKRVQESQKNKGVFVTKIGRGESADYIIEELLDNKAITMYEENKDLKISEKALGLTVLEFQIFLALISSPRLILRDTPRGILEYMGFKSGSIDTETFTRFREAAITLALNNFIFYGEDKRLVHISLKTDAEMGYNLSLMMRQWLRELTLKNNIRSESSLIKVYVSIEIMYERNITCFTLAQLEALLNMSSRLISKCLTILSKENLIAKHKLYNSNTKHCIGQIVELNGFYYIRGESYGKIEGGEY